MKEIIERINQALEKENFAVVQIYGSQGSGKTILANAILSKFPDYDIRRIHDLRPLQDMYIDNRIEVIEDLHYVWCGLKTLHIKTNISHFYSKPNFVHNAKLIRILVTARKIDLESQFTAYRHYKDSIIDVTTGSYPSELPSYSKGINRRFLQKWRNVFKRKLKTRPYLITSKPLVIGRYKKHELQSSEAVK